MVHDDVFGVVVEGGCAVFDLVAAGVGFGTLIIRHQLTILEIHWHYLNEVPRIHFEVVLRHLRSLALEVLLLRGARFHVDVEGVIVLVVFVEQQQLILLNYLLDLIIVEVHIPNLLIPVHFSQVPRYIDTVEEVQGVADVVTQLVLVLDY